MLRNFSFIIDGELAGSAQPGWWDNLDRDFEDISSKGIKAIVSLTLDSLPDKFVKKYNIDYLHIPIPDFNPPQLEQIFKFVSFVDKCRKEKKPVLVHCHAGIGRTGTLLAAYLVHIGYESNDAIKQVRKIRFGSIENEDQINSIFEYEQAAKYNIEG